MVGTEVPGQDDQLAKWLPSTSCPLPRFRGEALVSYDDIIARRRATIPNQTIRPCGVRTRARSHSNARLTDRMAAHTVTPEWLEHTACGTAGRWVSHLTHILAFFISFVVACNTMTQPLSVHSCNKENRLASYGSRPSDLPHDWYSAKAGNGERHRTGVLGPDFMR